MTADLIMRGILAVAVIVVGITLIVAHRSHRHDEFCLLDLLMENGRISKFSCILMGSFMVTTWIVAHLAVTGKLTEGYLTIYGALWITPSVAKLLKGDTPPAEQKGDA